MDISTSSSSSPKAAFWPSSSTSSASKLSVRARLVGHFCPTSLCHDNRSAMREYELDTCCKLIDELPLHDAVAAVKLRVSARPTAQTTVSNLCWVQMSTRHAVITTRGTAK